VKGVDSLGAEFKNGGPERMRRIERMQEQLQLSLSRSLESFGVSWKK